MARKLKYLLKIYDYIILTPNHQQCNNLKKLYKDRFWFIHIIISQHYVMLLTSQANPSCWPMFLSHVTQKSWQKQLKRSMRLAIFSPRVLPMSMVREKIRDSRKDLFSTILIHDDVVRSRKCNITSFWRNFRLSDDL